MYNQITSNKRRSVALMIIITLFVVAVAYAIQYVYGYGYGFLIFALGFSLISNLIAYFSGDKIALSVNRAKEISKEDNPYVYRIVENLCITAGLPAPRVYIIEDSAMNAFATGRGPKHASIALTTGLIQNLENEELEGVIAHELSHIQNYDVRLMTLVAALIGTLMIMIDFAWRLSFGRRSGKSHPAFALIGLALIILSPLIGKLIQFSISRRREYLADASGALLTRYPQGLANALRKISLQSQPMSHANHSTAHLFISNPFGQEFRKGINKFFSTHPPIEDRIQKLLEAGNVKV